MSPEDAPAAPPAPRSSHTSTTQWQSFEMRMRRRRAERCVMRAEVAIEAGFLEEARLALEEARFLDSGVPEFDALYAAVTGQAPPVPPTPTRRRRAVPAAIGLAILIIVAGALIGLKLGDRPGRATSQPASAPAPAPPTQAPSAPSPSAPRGAVIATEIVRPEVEVAKVPVARLTTIGAATLRSERATPQLQTQAVERAVLHGGQGIADPAPPAPGISPPKAVEPATSPKEPATGMAGSASAASSSPAPATSPASPPRPDERARVRAALALYEAAFSSLSVDGVRAVWPAVDARSLSRAFNGLESQRLSLGQCSVTVDAATAHADCRGQATWTPKIGGDTRGANRNWQFELRNVGEAWQIVRVMAR